MKNLQEQLKTDLINEIEPKATNGWIEGEYKWMPPSVLIMPTGWKKVVTEGEGIVTLGFGSSRSQKSISWNSDDDKKGNVTLGTTAFDEGYFVLINSPNTSLMPINVVKTENLWQYDPFNIYSKTDAIYLNIQISKVETKVETKETELIEETETIETTEE